MRKLLLTLAALYALGGAAQTESAVWAIQDPSGGTVVPVGSVGFLLSSDNQDTFSIICKDGTLVDGLSTVNIVKTTPTGIGSAAVPAATPQLSGSVAGRLSLTGCRAGTRVAVYDAAGRAVLATVAADGRADLDVSALASGLYVLKAGDTAIKFIKK